MRVLHTIAEARQWRREVGAAGGVALVPTMGALHAGHLRHVEVAKRHAERVVVSIFVNPTQFAPGEDFERYPRPLERDLELCEAAGASAVFAPSAGEMYPLAPGEPGRPGPGSSEAADAQNRTGSGRAGSLDATIDVPALTGTLEGAHRPGHFAGVCRVVMKLLQIVQPDVATFGEKDYQQLRVIEAMVADLNVPVEVVRVPTLREADGLAMSSRNAYLKDDERERATALYRALAAARETVREWGDVEAAALEARMREVLEAAGLAVDYAAVRRADMLAAVERVRLETEPARGLIAARLGSVRLIDNMALNGSERGC